VFFHDYPLPVKLKERKNGELYVIAACLFYDFLKAEGAMPFIFLK
jgi:hypothetical protein